MLDTNGDGLSDLVLPDADAALSTPGNPITQWSIARSLGAAPPMLGSAVQAFSEEWVFVDNPSGPADPAVIQPELGTPIDYDQDGRTDILLHDVHGASLNWLVLLSQPSDTFKLHDTGIARPFPLHVTPSIAPLVALDLRPVDEDRPDGRDLITTEPPICALHRWDGRNLVTHYETVSDWHVLAHYTEKLQGMIQGMFSERGAD